MGHPEFHAQRVGNTGGGLIRNKNASSTKRDVVMKFYGLPPIGQKQRRPMDGAQFHFPQVGEAGGRLIRNKNASSTKRNVVMKFYGVPPIGQKQRHPMDGAQFPRRSAETVGD
jgi:prolyl-tRNA editing enzyme YbaK/EbsC (Cys-tRNA(Pro) deacylase)